MHPIFFDLIIDRLFEPVALSFGTPPQTPHPNPSTLNPARRLGIGGGRARQQHGSSFGRIKVTGLGLVLSLALSHSLSLAHTHSLSLSHTHSESLSLYLSLSLSLSEAGSSMGMMGEKLDKLSLVLPHKPYTPHPKPSTLNLEP